MYTRCYNSDASVHRVMSSYSFGDNSDQGPPHNADYSTADVPINSDGSCGGGWVCEHRWPSIANMAAFRNAVAGSDVTHFQQYGDVVGFGRGNKVGVEISLHLFVKLVNVLISCSYKLVVLNALLFAVVVVVDVVVVVVVLMLL